MGAHLNILNSPNLHPKTSKNDHFRRDQLDSLGPWMPSTWTCALRTPGPRLRSSGGASTTHSPGATGRAGPAAALRACVASKCRTPGPGGLERLSFIGWRWDQTAYGRWSGLMSGEYLITRITTCIILIYKWCKNKNAKEKVKHDFLLSICNV